MRNFIFYYILLFNTKTIYDKNAVFYVHISQYTCIFNLVLLKMFKSLIEYIFHRSTTITIIVSSSKLITDDTPFQVIYACYKSIAPSRPIHM